MTAAGGASRMRQTLGLLGVTLAAHIGLCWSAQFVQAYIKLKKCPPSQYDTACALAGMLAGFMEWVAGGMLGYDYRQKKEVVVSSCSQLQR